MNGENFNEVIKKKFYVDVQKLTKKQLAQVLEDPALEKKKKEVLLSEIEKSITSDFQIRKLYKKFAEAMAIHPNDLEEILDITKTERKRWTEEKRLKVALYDVFKKWGKDISVPLYDRYAVYKITHVEIERWREEHRLNKTKNTKIGIKKAMATKNLDEQMREEFKKEWKKKMVYWYKEDALLAATFNLAFWTLWISRWAKENQLKHGKGLKENTRERYLNQKELLYQFKNDAIRLLLKSPFTTVSFYRPSERPDKEFLHFCENHYEDWIDTREKMYEFISKWDYLKANKKEIIDCADCDYIVDKDFYSLYHIEINDEREEIFRFSFHIPYPIGNSFLPIPEKLKFVQHDENEGIFRFGRSLMEKEKIIFSEKKVMQEFKNGVIKYELFVKSPHEASIKTMIFYR